MATIQETRESFRSGRAVLVELDQKLSTELLSIDDKASEENRDLTPEETARIDEIEETCETLSLARKKLALAGLDQLNSSSAVEALNTQIQGINETLEEKLERLKKIEGYAETVVKVLVAIAKAAEKVAELIV